MKKRCFKCLQEKPFEQFYRHSKMADGLLGKCKTCTKKDVQASRAARIDYYRAYDKKRGGTLKRKAKVARYLKFYAENRADRRRAQIAVGNAVRDGRLHKSPCRVCGQADKVHAHHDDYTKPLAVIWLCAIHHHQRHKALRQLDC